MERFVFDEQIDARMADKELRCEVIKAFADLSGKARRSRDRNCKEVWAQTKDRCEGGSS